MFEIFINKADAGEGGTRGVLLTKEPECHTNLHCLLLILPEFTAI